jgi:electron transport complex protein RnfC
MTKRYSFKGGVHPASHTSNDKALTSSKPVIKLKPPELVIIPLLQHTGSPAKPLVQPGETVVAGQKIGEATSFVSAHVHASISGIVKAVKNHPHLSGSDVLSVFIENDYKGEMADFAKPDVPALSPKDIVACIKEAGIVGMGGASFPAHVKYTPPPDKPIDTVILNGAECEPYLTTDHRLMTEHAAEVVKGLELIAKAVDAKDITIAIEDNKPDAIKALSEAAPAQIKLFVMKTKYPQGAEKQIITSVTGREVPSCGLPYEVGVVVANASTAYAVYQAVYFGVPSYERVVTVTGCVKEPANFLCPVGTPFSVLFEAAGGFTEQPAKVISGGPMMGIAVSSLDLTVTKGTSGLLALTEKQVKKQLESNCIRCGRCVEVCPIGLKPLYINAYALKNDFETCEKYNAVDCIECGCCSYICPARRYLLPSIRLAKAEIIKSRKKK